MLNCDRWQSGQYITSRGYVFSSFLRSSFVMIAFARGVLPKSRYLISDLFSQILHDSTNFMSLLICFTCSVFLGMTFCCYRLIRISF